MTLYNCHMAYPTFLNLLLNKTHIVHLKLSWPFVSFWKLICKYDNKSRLRLLVASLSCKKSGIGKLAWVRDSDQSTNDYLLIVTPLPGTLAVQGTSPPKRLLDSSLKLFIQAKTSICCNIYSCRKLTVTTLVGILAVQGTGSQNEIVAFFFLSAQACKDS